MNEPTLSEFTLRGNHKYSRWMGIFIWKKKKTTVENKKAEVEGERRHPLQFNMLHSVSCPLFWLYTRLDFSSLVSSFESSKGCQKSNQTIPFSEFPRPPYTTLSHARHTQKSDCQRHRQRNHLVIVYVNCAYLKFHMVQVRHTLGSFTTGLNKVMTCFHWKIGQSAIVLLFILIPFR